MSPERNPQPSADADALRKVIVENADGILVVGADTRIRFANPAAGDLFGRAETSLLGTDFGFPLVLDDCTEINVVRPDGALRFADMRVVATTWESDDAYIVSLRDTTDRKQLEERLASAERLEALGRLAGGIAHDFNNMLTSIMCEANLLLQELPDSGNDRARIEHIRTIVNRASRLTHQLLAFSRRRVSDIEFVNLNDVVAEIVGMLRTLFTDEIELVIETSAAPIVVRENRTQLEQVVMNLLLNARDAMPDGGTLTIGTQTVATTADLDNDEAAPTVELFVRDTGCGMTEQVKARLFEPFFTTKQKHGGTGLGLAVVYGIVRQSGGQILVNSAPGAGAEFRVLLPAATDAVAHPGEAVPENADDAANTKTRQRIMLAEDEEAIVDVVSEILTQAGHDVLVARDGMQAWQQLAAATEPIDLLITDVMMPGLTGDELTARVLKRWPHTRVVMVSGYADDVEAIQQQIGQGSVKFLHKPFTPDSLLGAIDEALRPLPRAATVAPQPVTAAASAVAIPPASTTRPAALRR